MKNYWYVPLVLFVGWLWLHEHDKLVLAQAETRAVADSARVQLAKIDSLVIEGKKKDAQSLLVQSQLSHQRHIDSTLQAVTQVDTDSLVAVAESRATDSVKAVIQLANESFERERVSFRAQIASSALLEVSLRGQIAQKDSIIATQTSAIAQLNGQVQHLSRVAQPSTLSRVMSLLPYVVGGYAVGKAL